MAKKSMKAREVRRIELNKKLGSKRKDLCKARKDLHLSIEERMENQFRLQRMPVDSCAGRQQRRCFSCGRPRAVYRKFKLCRICLRNAFNDGDLAGARKASW